MATDFVCSSWLGENNCSFAQRILTVCFYMRFHLIRGANCVLGTYKTVRD